MLKDFYLSFSAVCFTLLVAWLLLFEEAPSDHARAGQLVRHDGAGRGQPWPDVRGQVRSVVSQR